MTVFFGIWLFFRISRDMSAAMPTADPNSAGRHGPKRAPAAIGAGGCPCCFGQVFADALKRAKARRTI